MSLLDECVFRALEPAEVKLLLDSWAKSFRSSDHAGTIPNHMYPSVMRELIAGLIARGARVIAADVAGRVAGYVCYETKASECVLHYVYVKDAYRKQGLGKHLVNCARANTERLFYTHKTPAARYVLPRGSVFCPEIARRKVL